MTDDKKPRVGVMLFLGHNPLIQPQLSGTHAHLAESVPMIEKSAYDSLAERLKVAEAEIETYKIKEKNLIENWGEANAEIERLNALAKENERLKNALEQTIDNAHETATLLARENERLAKIQQDDESEKYKYMDERDQLNTELLNTKELSSKLVEENAALKAEVDMKEYERVVHEERANKFLDETVALEDALKIEREISAMLREALENIKDYETQTIYGYSSDEQLAIDDAWSRTADVAKEAIAREKEMRK